MLYGLAIFLPGVAVLFRGRIGAAIGLTLMQVSVILWIPASAIAMHMISDSNTRRTIRREIRATHQVIVIGNASTVVPNPGGITAPIQKVSEPDLTIEPQAYLARLIMLSCAYAFIAPLAFGLNNGFLLFCWAVTVAVIFWLYRDDVLTLDKLVNPKAFQGYFWRLSLRTWYYVAFWVFLPISIGVFLFSKFVHYLDYKTAYDARLKADIERKEKELKI